MQKVKVGLEKHSYDILIGHGLIKNSGQIIAPLLSKNHVVVITDQNVAPLHLHYFESSMKSAGVSISSLVVPGGESTKSWKYLIRVVEWILEQRSRNLRKFLLLCLLKSIVPLEVKRGLM